jgi:hypothetical protein
MHLSRVESNFSDGEHTIGWMLGILIDGREELADVIEGAVFGTKIIWE